MIILSLAAIPVMEVPAIYQTTENHPRGVFKCRAPLLSPMAHARGIKMIPGETAHTLKDTRHFCSTPVPLPVARLSLVAPDHSLIRQRSGSRPNERAPRATRLIE